MKSSMFLAWGLKGSTQGYLEATVCAQSSGFWALDFEVLGSILSLADALQIHIKAREFATGRLQKKSELSEKTRVKV